MEMTLLWKSKNDSHRSLEISHRTRDSHISTADHLCFRSGKRRMNRPDSGSLSERPTGLVSERRAQQSEVAGVEGVSGLGDNTHRRVGEITDRIGGSQQRAMKMAKVVAS